MQSQLIGHKPQADLFLNAVNSGRLHHAWILSGPKGIGKYKFAQHMAHHLLDEASSFSGIIEAQNSVWQRMNASGHCDFTIVQPEIGKQLGVDKIRALDGFLHKTTAEGGYRVVIIDDADKMNKAAANALLKSLEEPRPKTIFFLVVSDSSTLPRTIFSRCQQLVFRNLATEDMNSVVNILKIKCDTDVLTMANGSPGNLVKLVDNSAIVSQLVRGIQELPIASSMPFKQVIELGGSDDEMFELIVSIIFKRLHMMAEGGAASGSAISIDKLGEIWKDFSNLYRDYKQVQLDRLAILMCMFASLERRSL